MKNIAIAAFLLLLMTACNKDFMSPQDDMSHSPNTIPDYATVFNATQMNTVEILFTPAQRDSTTVNLDTLIREFQRNLGFTTNKKARLSNSLSMPVVVKFNDKAWNKIGFKLHESAGLLSSILGGSQKLPFRLTTDAFGTQYPALKDQKLHGFRELIFLAASDDSSIIKERVLSEVYREAGLPYPKTSYCKVSINFGQNTVYCGVYTVVEAFEDTFLKSQFSDNGGNLYQPNSTLGSFAREEFTRRTNTNSADFSDIQRFITVLNQANRKTTPSVWRSELEQVFAMNDFIKWLAVNTVMGNGDTYGKVARDYYLYNAPDRKLRWLHLDNTRSMSNPILFSTGTTAERLAVQLDLSNVGAEWVLIRAVAEDTEYFKQYKQAVRDFRDKTFNSARMNALLDENTAFVRDFVAGSQVERVPYSNLRNTAAFQNALPALKQWVVDRNKAVDEFLK